MRGAGEEHTSGADMHITAAGGVVFRIGRDEKPVAGLNQSGHEPGYLNKQDSTRGGTSAVQILLIYRNGFWDLPKGKRDVGESIPACAAREVAEEVHCEIPALLTMIARTEHTYEQGGKTIDKTTWWYSMVIKPGELLPQIEEGIQAVEWVDLAEARSRVGFDNLVTALDAFSQWFDNLQIASV